MRRALLIGVLILGASMIAVVSVNAETAADCARTLAGLSGPASIQGMGTPEIVVHLSGSADAVVTSYECIKRSLPNHKVVSMKTEWSRNGMFVAVLLKSPEKCN